MDPARAELIADAERAAAEAETDDERSRWERIRDIILSLDAIARIPVGGLTGGPGQVAIGVDQLRDVGGRLAEDAGVDPAQLTPGGIADAVGGWFEEQMEEWVEQLLTGALALVFVVASLALILVGLSRTFGVDVRGPFAQRNS